MQDNFIFLDPSYPFSKILFLFLNVWIVFPLHVLLEVCFTEKYRVFKFELRGILHQFVIRKSYSIHQKSKKPRSFNKLRFSLHINFFPFLIFVSFNSFLLVFIQCIIKWPSWRWQAKYTELILWWFDKFCLIFIHPIYFSFTIEYLSKESLVFFSW